MMVSIRPWQRWIVAKSVHPIAQVANHFAATFARPSRQHLELSGSIYKLSQNVILSEAKDF
jgi:hypothetical protein